MGSPTQCGAPGEPKTCSADSNCESSVTSPFPGHDWVGPCSECDRGYSCLDECSPRHPCDESTGGGGPLRFSLHRPLCVRRVALRDSCSTVRIVSKSGEAPHMCKVVNTTATNSVGCEFLSSRCSHDPDCCGDLQ